jgi:hypothetical protein
MDFNIKQNFHFLNTGLVRIEHWTECFQVLWDANSLFPIFLQRRNEVIFFQISCLRIQQSIVNYVSEIDISLTERLIERMILYLNLEISFLRRIRST